jgi:hypothetical protein
MVTGIIFRRGIMSKIYLDVQVPGTARTYEFAADSVMTVGKVKRQFISQISAVEGREVFSEREQVLFCSRALEGLLKDHEVLGEVGVDSGDTVILL